MRLKCVLYRDEEREPSILPAMQAPSTVAALRSHLEKQTDRAIRLISYWNYRHSRYDALLSMDQLAQQDALLLTSSASRSSLRQTDTESGAAAQPSHTGTHNSSGGSGSSNHLYRAQLWLESSFSRVEQIDPSVDKAEFRELAQHVRHFAGNKHISYELTRAARLQYGYLSRMFDRTREEGLHANKESVRLLFYANNAWATTDVMKYGFLLREDLPTSLEDVLRTGTGGGTGLRSPSLADLAGATSTTGSDGLARNANDRGNRNRSPTRDAAEVLGGGGDGSAANTRRHPFTFTSSMLHPKDKKPALKGPQKVLLCEVAPGRAWVVDEPITTLVATGGGGGSSSANRNATGPANPDSLESPPEGYDSIVYEGEAERHRDGSRKSTPQNSNRSPPEKRGCGKHRESQETASESPLTQVMVGLSHQALPRYLLTIEPRKPEEATGFFRGIFGASNSSSTRRKSGAEAEAEEGEGRSSAPRTRDGSVRNFARTNTSPARAARGNVDRSSTQSSPAARSYRHEQQQQQQQQHPGVVATSPSERHSLTPERTPRPLSAPSRSLSPPEHASKYLPMYSSRLRGNQRSERTPERQSPQVQQPLRHSLVPLSDTLEEAKGPHLHPQQQQQQLPMHSATTGTYTRGSGSSPRNTTATFAPQLDDLPRQSGNAPYSSPPRQQGQPQPRFDPNLPFVSESGSAPPSGPRQRTVPPSHQPLLPPSRGGSASPTREGSGHRDGLANFSVPSHSQLQGQQRPSASQPSQQLPASPSRAPPSAMAIPQALRCPAHPSNLVNIYCVSCRELTCPYCASVGNHRGHDVMEAEAHAATVQKTMQEMCHDLSQWLDHFTRVQRQLVAEAGEAQGHQARRAQALRGQLAEVRRAIDAKERLLLKQLTDQGEQGKPPVAEAAAVRTKYADALRPLELCLRNYQAGHAPPPDRPHGANSHASVSTLQFLRAAPQLLAEANAFFRGRDKQEETRLKAAIAAVRGSNQRADELLSRIDTAALREQVDLLGTGSSGGGKDRLLMAKSAQSTSATRHLRGRSGSPLPRSMQGRQRQRAATEASTSRYDDWSTTSPTRGNVSGGRNRDTSVYGEGDDAEDLGSQSSRAANLSLVERCLLDLQRGHIWAIQNASRFFCVGQTKAVCSTPFRLKGLDWELRIAAMPAAEEQNNGVLLLGPARQQQSPQRPASPAAGASVKSRPIPQVVRLPGTLTDPGDGVGPDGIVLSRAPSLVATTRGDNNNNNNSSGVGEGGVTRSPLQPGSLLPFQPGVMGQLPEVADEDQWLGIFLFPLGHTRRLDFRVIAFSEVSWTEWKVVGWQDAFAGKGWGLYPFLRRKDLMRLDKLARDNIVKICITPISDLY